jgi:hypothetical protein
VLHRIGAIVLCGISLGRIPKTRRGCIRHRGRSGWHDHQPRPTQLGAGHKSDVTPDEARTPISSSTQVWSSPKAGLSRSRDLSGQAATGVADTKNYSVMHPGGFHRKQGIRKEWRSKRGV